MFIESAFWFHPLVWWIGRDWWTTASAPATNTSFTNRTDSWRILLEDRYTSRPGGQAGVYDVKSGSDAIAIDGTTYSQW